jgi:hypothetical protein
LSWISPEAGRAATIAADFDPDAAAPIAGTSMAQGP